MIAARVPARARLSDREHDVLLLLADGLGPAAIGDQLFMSESTAKSHIARIYQKLGAANRAQALVTAMRTGLLSSSVGPQRLRPAEGTHGPGMPSSMPDRASPLVINDYTRPGLDGRFD